MTASAETVALGGMVLYHPQIEVWSGTVRIRRDEDYAAETAAALPPSAIVTDGRKRLVPTKPLRAMLNARKGVERLLKRKGFGFMGGIAVPEAKVAEIEAELPHLEKAFQEGVDDLCARLEEWYGELEDEHPEWVNILRASRLSADEVRKRCSFQVLPIKAAPPEAPGAAERFRDFSGAAFPSLLKNMSERAEYLLNSSLKAKETVTQKTVNAVREMIRKLDSFSFVDPRVAPLAESLDIQIQALPKTGPLNKGQTAVLAAALESIVDPVELLESLGNMEQAAPEQEAPEQMVLEQEAPEIAPEQEAPEITPEQEAPEITALEPALIHGNVDSARQSEYSIGF